MHCVFTLKFNSAAANTGRRIALRPQVGIPGMLAIQGISWCTSEPEFLSACRSLHTSKSALLAQPATSSPSSTTSATEPITLLANRDSNQFSLEHPQNKAGMSPMDPVIDFEITNAYRVCFIDA